MQSFAKQAEKQVALARGAYLLLVLIAGYGVIWMVTGGIGGVLLRLGWARSEAALFSSLLGLLLYPALVIAALALRRPLRFWAVLLAVSLLAMACSSWGIR